MGDQGPSLPRQIEAKKNLSPGFLIDDPAPGSSGASLAPQHSDACPTKANLDSDPKICKLLRVRPNGAFFYREE